MEGNVALVPAQTLFVLIKYEEERISITKKIKHFMRKLFSKIIFAFIYLSMFKFFKRLFVYDTLHTDLGVLPLALFHVELIFKRPEKSHYNSFLLFNSIETQIIYKFMLWNDLIIVSFLSLNRRKRL